jgi:hypothetical protein
VIFVLVVEVTGQLVVVPAAVVATATVIVVAVAVDCGCFSVLARGAYSLMR